MVDPLRRLEGVRELIDRQSYFVLHAPRQAGKTTALTALAERLMAEGRYAAALVSCESGRATSDDVRDYKVSTDQAGHLGGASPFNIRETSLTLRYFTRDEVAELYAQHTDDTGQAFTTESVDLAFRWTNGQPWLVNALAREATDVLERDRSHAITVEVIEAARERVIARQDTHLDSRTLLGAFLAFWQQHAEALFGSAPYHEIAPHLVLMAFLHRVVNGGGRIEREYAVGSKRMDLLVEYGPPARRDRLAMELKVWRPSEADPREDGLAPLDGYLAGLGLDTGWLVIFDRRPGQPPLAQRTRSEAATTPSGRAVTVVRA